MKVTVVAFRLLLAVVATTVALLICEWLLRSGIVDAYRQHTRAANQNIDWRAEKPAHVVRIVTLGDSFTAGTDNYPDRLRERLDRLPPPWRYELLNLAVP